MSANPVFIFVAGATRACGGSLTGEILPDVFRIKKDIERERGARHQIHWVHCQQCVLWQEQMSVLCQA